MSFQGCISYDLGIITDDGVPPNLNIPGVFNCGHFTPTSIIHRDSGGGVGFHFNCGRFIPIIHRDFSHGDHHNSDIHRWADMGFVSTLLASRVCCFACRIQDMAKGVLFSLRGFEGSTKPCKKLW